MHCCGLALDLMFMVPYLASKKDMTDIFKSFLRKKCKSHVAPQPLRIEGCKPPMTPEPDEAEIAAKALLEQLSGKDVENGGNGKQKPEAGSPAYYHRLADRIREGRATEAHLVMRYLAYCEQELQNPLLSPGQVADLKKDLYKRIDVVDREGGELKRRWQHCLADVTVRLMNTLQP